MYICKVQGKCVSTIKHQELAGYGLVTVQRLNAKGGLKEEVLVAVDPIGCSIGETVVTTSGSGARMALGSKESPVDLTIIGIVDSCDIEEM